MERVPAQRVTFRHQSKKYPAKLRKKGRTLYPIDTTLEQIVEAREERRKQAAAKQRLRRRKPQKLSAPLMIAWPLERDEHEEQLFWSDVQFCFPELLLHCDVPKEYLQWMREAWGDESSSSDF